MCDSLLPTVCQVVLHDLASADARDIPRAACFESRAPTALAFLLLNLPSLTGYSASGGAAQAKVGTSCVEPDLGDGSLKSHRCSVGS